MISVKKGLELEFFVTDENFNPNSNVYNIVRDLGHENISHEYGPYQFEIASNPSTSYLELESNIKEYVNMVQSRLDEGSRLLSVGAFPLEFNPLVSPNERLNNITNSTNEMFDFANGEGVELETGLQAFQVNYSLVGSEMSETEQIIYLNNILRPTIPIMVALTANSPVFQNSRVHTNSYLERNGGHPILNGRRHIWERCEGKGNVNLEDTICGFGIPESYESYDDYIDYLTHFGGRGNPVGVESQLYVDIRPRTEDKAGNKFANDEIRVEYRPCDMLCTLGENLGVSALLEGHILSCLDGNNVLSNISSNTNELEVLSSNAGRFGLNCQVDDRNLRDYAHLMISQARDYLDEVSFSYVENLIPLLEETRAQQQIRMGTNNYLDEILNEFDYN